MELETTWKCTKCKEPCTTELVLAITPAPWRTAGIWPHHVRVSQCCRAEVVKATIPIPSQQERK